MAEIEEYVEDFVSQTHDEWVRSGPSTLVSEMERLITESGMDGLVLSQEAAMMACVESKRNAELQKIRKALEDINFKTV
jgi:chitinase